MRPIRFLQVQQLAGIPRWRACTGKQRGFTDLSRLYVFLEEQTSNWAVVNHLLAARRRLGLRIYPIELVQVSPRQRRVVHDHQVLVVVLLGAGGKSGYPGGAGALRPSTVGVLTFIFESGYR
jgi:hypothetical protein